MLMLGQICETIETYEVEHVVLLQAVLSAEDPRWDTTSRRIVT